MIIKRLYIFLIMVLLSLSLFSKEKLTWVYIEDGIPICWEENGKPTGLGVEIVQRIADKLNIEVEHKFYPWVRAQSMVAEGLADGMITTPTSKRFEYALIGKEIAIPIFFNVYYRKSDSNLKKRIIRCKNLEDLKGLEIIDYYGNGWTKSFLKEGYKIKTIYGYPKAIEVLSGGRGDIMITSSSRIDWWQKKLELENNLDFHKIEWPSTRFHFSLMISRKSSWRDKGLLRAMDEELREMKESGEWFELLKKYKNPHGFGEDFNTFLDDSYNQKYGFYKEYDKYPVYRPQKY